MYSLQDLVTVVTVADSGSIRAAAAALGRTQPAVTQAIRRLEDEAGFQLLDRSAYRARLTDQGQAFVERARPLLRQLQTLREFGALLSRGVEPRLRLAIDTGAPPAAWTDLLQDVADRFPDTVLEVEAGEGLAPLRRLSEGTADLAVVFDLIGDQAAASLERTSLGQAGFSTVVRADRRERLKTLSPSFPQIVVADFDRPDPEFGRVEAQHYWRVASHRLQFEGICAGLGSGCVPDALLAEAEPGALASVAHAGLSQHSVHGLSLCRRRGHGLGPVAVAIWDAAVRLKRDAG